MDCQRIIDRYHVTSQQLDAVAYFVDQSTGQPLFKVQSANNPDVTYTVKWNTQYNRPQCECKAACDGRLCWHCRACVAVLSIHAQARRDQADIARQIRLDDAELQAEREYRDYLDSIEPFQWPPAQVEHDAERYAPRPFSLLR